MAKRLLNDHFSRLAKAKGYVARSSFKLLEIQERFRVVRPGAHVLDLGCAPGAWLQVACQSLGKKSGFVLGLDIQACPVPRSFCDDRVRILQADARELRPVDLVSMHSVHSAAASSWSGGFHAVLSDMCHSTVGNSAADVLRSLELAQTAAAIAVGDREERDKKASLEEMYSTGPAGGRPGVLLPGGHFVVKLLQGSGSQEFAQELRQHFAKVTWVQPAATRQESREMYLVGLNRRH
ncbi:23S ribosomal RNA methyltransferase [Coccomyxa subellipsoidea C-169]|uniref:rRNA methyltransferase 2, mitochondrial n=1 Tax=Coccomyxa subellipsoidea (strain C-169) TaxID=574566 RepID=I0Z088_COCSC|nr:23S ribosomal RNA methyltransferase [Coccomyxa subellipsoidea C-169]EIE24057.1 23S ribosomal RNA methyltransferase [Coccomyxa subellipsoidea C-169]|eukprot:XP_005648601.1 23S ribosomal RNA methyltransferase [Coccomyxa subellipsoidea C-169]